jgi:hypothetical protein
MENKIINYMKDNISSFKIIRQASSVRAVKYLPAIIAFAISLSGCVKVALDYTDHPDSGKIILLTTDWTNRGAGIDIPAVYNVKVGDYTTTLSGATNAVNYLLAPGEYHINIWNTADHISVNGSTANADYGQALLGWLFTGAADQTIEADMDYTVNVDMRQQVRQLTLELEPTGDAKDFVTGIAASLSGVAGAIDINTGDPAGNAVSVDLAFAKDGGKYYSVIRLLGITGADQKLTLTLNYANGNPSSQTIVCDLSSPLADFNADKKTPLTLNAEAIVTPTVTGFTATIDDWIDNGGTIIAE